jgi:uncharacterized protein YndB with AHSA1/START domain
MTTITLPTDPNGTTIEADPDLPVITIVRDFAAPADRVFRAWTDPELVTRWMGPNEVEMKIDRWDATTGGHYRYTVWQGGQEVAGFYGSFHEVRPSERLVWTFTWEGMPDGVSLETMTFTDLGDGRTRLTSVSVVDSLEGRDAILASGMEVGVYEGYAKLDAVLARG